MSDLFTTEAKAAWVLIAAVSPYISDTSAGFTRGLVAFSVLAFLYLIILYLWRKCEDIAMDEAENEILMTQEEVGAGCFHCGGAFGDEAWKLEGAHIRVFFCSALCAGAARKNRYTMSSSQPLHWLPPEDIGGTK